MGKTFTITGKIINFNNKNKRGLIMVQVRNHEGRREYQHLQFSSRHFDTSIEKHIYENQEVKVAIQETDPGKYSIQNISYDVGAHLYRSMPFDNAPTSRSPRSRNYQSSREYRKDSRPRKSYNNNQRTENRSRNRRPSNKNRRDDPRFDNKDRNKDRRSKPYSDSRNRREDKYKRQTPSTRKTPRKPQHSFSEKKQKNRNKKTQIKPKPKPNKLFELAIHLHYRRIKLQRINRLKLVQNNRKQQYRRMALRR